MIHGGYSMTDDQRIVNAFDEIDRSLKGRMGAMTAAETMTRENLCDTYMHVRPWLETIMPVVGRISSSLAAVIRLLMRIADSACSIS